MSMYGLATALLFVVWITGLAVIPFWYIFIPAGVWLALYLFVRAVETIERNNRWDNR